MLFCNNLLFDEARAAKFGRLHLPQPLEDLRSWVSKEFAIKVLHVVFDKIELDPCEGEPRLTLIVDSAVDYAKVKQNPITLRPGVEEHVLKKFVSIVAAAGCEDQYDTANILLLFDDFSEEAMRRAANEFQERDKQRVIDEFAQFSVWTIDGFFKEVVVFYVSDRDVQTNQRIGVSERIKQRCCELVKQYDEFGYFQLATFPIVFDSKENLDKHYEGSLFMYFR